MFEYYCRWGRINFARTAAIIGLLFAIFETAVGSLTCLVKTRDLLFFAPSEKASGWLYYPTEPGDAYSVSFFALTVSLEHFKSIWEFFNFSPLVTHLISDLDHCCLTIDSKPLCYHGHRATLTINRTKIMMTRILLIRTKTLMTRILSTDLNKKLMTGSLKCWSKQKYWWQESKKQ